MKLLNNGSTTHIDYFTQLELLERNFSTKLRNTPQATTLNQ